MNVEKINNAISGTSVENTINIDTGDKEGFVVEYEGVKKGEPYYGQPLTVYFDHHAIDSKAGTSSTKYVYETLLKLGLLEQDPVLAKAVEFVTQEDNRSFPNEEKYYFDTADTLLGLGRHVEFNKLYEFFKAGLSPVQKLTPEQIAEFGLEEAQKNQKKTVAKTEPLFNELQRNGFVINSSRYGKVLVDIGGRFNREAGGFVGAKAMGAGAFVIWNPLTESFMLSVKDKTFPEDLLPQGRRLRGSMWIKDKAGPLEITLEQALKALMGRGYKLSDNIQRTLKIAEGYRPRPAIGGGADNKAKKNL